MYGAGQAIIKSYKSPDKKENGLIQNPQTSKIEYLAKIVTS